MTVEITPGNPSALAHDHATRIDPEAPPLSPRHPGDLGQAYTYGAIDATAALGLSSRPRVIALDEMWRALRSGAGLVDSFNAFSRLNRQKGAVTIMVTHSLKDTEAMPNPQDRIKAAGLMGRCDTLILGASSHAELEAVRKPMPLTSEEIRVIWSWSNPIGTAIDGTDRKHPGRGKYRIKIGHRIDVPVGLTPTADAQSRGFDRAPQSADAMAVANRRGRTFNDAFLALRVGPRHTRQST